MLGESRTEVAAKAAANAGAARVSTRETAALEGVWSGRIIANDATVSAPMVFVFGVRDGRIVKETDYVVLPS